MKVRNCEKVVLKFILKYFSYNEKLHRRYKATSKELSAYKTLLKHKPNHKLHFIMHLSDNGNDLQIWLPG